MAKKKKAAKKKAPRQARGKIIMNKVEFDRALKRLAHNIVEANGGAENLVLVGKLSRPIRIANSTTASLELTIDF